MSTPIDHESPETRTAMIDSTVKATIVESKPLLTQGQEVKQAYLAKNPDVKTFSIENHIMDEVERRLGQQGITLDQFKPGRGRAPGTGKDEQGEVFREMVCKEVGEIPLDQESEAQIQKAVEEMIHINTAKIVAESKGLSVKELLTDKSWQLLGEVQKTLRSREPRDFNYDNPNINSSRVAELTRQACERVLQGLKE